MRQRQVDDALHRAFEHKAPRGKCRALVAFPLLTFFHYQHVLLVYNLQTRTASYTWHETPTDRRILAAALESLASDHRPQTTIDAYAAPRASSTPTQPAPPPPAPTLAATTDTGAAARLTPCASSSASPMTPEAAGRE